jgi:hypothetical protein
MDPALRFQEAILVVVGLCADGPHQRERSALALLGALLATHYKDEVRLRTRPAIVQQILLPPLATLARWLVKERTIERYLDLGLHPFAHARLGRLPERIMRRTK